MIRSPKWNTHDIHNIFENNKVTMMVKAKFILYVPKFLDTQNKIFLQKFLNVRFDIVFQICSRFYWIQFNSNTWLMR